jgi:tetratricopeptide (TPR) repeat protein
VLGTADDRAFGLAYSALGDRRARDYLLRAEPVDSEVKLRLAATETDERRAIVLYESVLRTSPGQTVALVNLGSLYANAGRLEDAGNLWERALAANPGIEAAVLNLARIRPPAEAKVILLHYLDFNPASVAARALLR